MMNPTWKKKCRNCKKEFQGSAWYVYCTKKCQNAVLKNKEKKLKKYKAEKHQKWYAVHKDRIKEYQKEYMKKGTAKLQAATNKCVICEKVFRGRLGRMTCSPKCRFEKNAQYQEQYHKKHRKALRERRVKTRALS